MAQHALPARHASPEEIEAAQAASEWAAIEAQPDFQELVAAKRRFIIPATIFFIVYYFALPILVGYFPSAMDVDVVGQINLAYLFALSQFFMAWILMYLYIRQARKWDEMSRLLVERLKGGAR